MSKKQAMEYNSLFLLTFPHLKRTGNVEFANLQYPDTGNLICVGGRRL